MAEHDPETTDGQRGRRRRRSPPETRDRAPDLEPDPGTPEEELRSPPDPYHDRAEQTARRTKSAWDDALEDAPQDQPGRSSASTEGEHAVGYGQNDDAADDWYTAVHHAPRDEPRADADRAQDTDHRADAKDDPDDEASDDSTERHRED